MVQLKLKAKTSDKRARWAELPEIMLGEKVGRGGKPTGKTMIPKYRSFNGLLILRMTC